MTPEEMFRHEALAFLNGGSVAGLTWREDIEIPKIDLNRPEGQEAFCPACEAEEAA